MTSRHFLLVAVLLTGAMTIFTVGDGAPPTRIAPVELAVLTAENWSSLAPAGKEVDAIVGDIVLRNGELVAIIAQPLATRNANMTVRDVAGALIDLTRRDDQSDQLSAYYPGHKRHPYREWTAADADGQRLEPAPVFTYRGEQASVTMIAAAGPDSPRVETSYSLRAGEPWLTMTSRFVNATEGPLSVSLTDSVRADGGREDMQTTPEGTVDRFTIVDNFWGQAYGVEARGRTIQVVGDRGTILKFLDAAGADSVTLAQGEEATLVRRVAPGRSLFEVASAFEAPAGVNFVPVRLLVLDDLRRPVPHAKLEIRGPGGDLGAVVSNARGDLTVPLEPGRFTVRASALGVVVAEELPLIVSQATQQEESLILPGYRPGAIAAKFTDEQGGPIPCKVEFVPAEGAPRPSFGPETAEFGVKNLYYAPHGEFTQALPAGSYEVVISHGPEFDAVFTSITVPPGETVPLTGVLTRSVDTSGWISSDFHSHASPSGDNTSSQLGRVLNLLCEHVEFAPCTEHNRISSYVPHIERLKIERWMGTCSGIELTGSPLPLNHQNAFPLHEHRHQQDGGGPTTDADPEVQIERLALWDDRSDKLVQQNHPDIGWLFFDKDGDGQQDEGYSRSFAYMDVIEVHPIHRVHLLEPYFHYNGDSLNHPVFNWLQLLNRGVRITGVVNTDAHYNFHGSGPLRNWIASPTDDPAAVQPLDIVHASEDGRVVMSNGPFVTFTVRDPGKEGRATCGEDLNAPSGKVQAHIKVQCANWLDVDRVFLLVNGRRHAEHDYSRESHPEMFGDGPVKFDKVLDVSLEADAHLIAVAAGEHSTIARIYGADYAEHHPAAITNPVFVNVDGGGFTPNKDTLDHPLRVKRQ